MQKPGRTFEMRWWTRKKTSLRSIHGLTSSLKKGVRCPSREICCFNLIIFLFFRIVLSCFVFVLSTTIDYWMAPVNEAHIVFFFCLRVSKCEQFVVANDVMNALSCSSSPFFISFIFVSSTVWHLSISTAYCFLFLHYGWGIPG